MQVVEPVGVRLRLTSRVEGVARGTERTIPVLLEFDASSSLAEEFVTLEIREGEGDGRVAIKRRLLSPTKPSTPKVEPAL